MGTVSATDEELLSMLQDWRMTHLDDLKDLLRKSQESILRTVENPAARREEMIAIISRYMEYEKKIDELLRNWDLQEEELTKKISRS